MVKSNLLELFVDIIGIDESRKTDQVEAKKEKKKTISFDWDRGGWNNIRMAMEVMVCLAKLFDRSLVIPKSSQWLLLADKAHMFDFYDKDTFETYVSTANTERPGRTFTFTPEMKLCDWGLVDVEQLQKYEDYDNWHFPFETRMFSYFPLGFSKPGQFFPLIKAAFRFKTALIEKTCKILADHNLELGNYIALHIRRNDFQYKKVTNRSAEDIVAHVTQTIPKNMPILILTDIFDQRIIDLFESKGHRTVCWGQKKGRGKVTLTESKESIVIDMLAAVPAHKFFGSQRSTFSTYIVHLRGLMHNLDSSIDSSILFTSMQSGSNASWWSFIDENYWERHPLKRLINWNIRNKKRKAVWASRLKHERNMARRAARKKRQQMSGTR